MAPLPPHSSHAQPHHAPSSNTSARFAGRIHILIVERDRMARLGVQHVLVANADLAIAGAVGTIEEATYLPASTSVDVVLVGSTVPDLDGTDGIRRLSIRFVLARVVLFSEEASPSWLLAALRAGADGVVSRTIDPAALARTVRRVARGEVALPCSLITHLVAALRLRTAHEQLAEALDRLTPREREVIAEVAAGRSNAEIAVRFGLSERTVKSHVSSILAKTGVRSRYALVQPPPSVQETA